MDTGKKWFGEVWFKHELVSERDDFAPRDNPRVAYEDAISWAAANLQHPDQAVCHAVTDDGEYFDEESYEWLTLEEWEAEINIGHVVAFTVKGKEIMAITEDGDEVPLYQVGGLLSRHADFLRPASEEEAWDKAAILAEDYSRELKAAV